MLTKIIQGLIDFAVMIINMIFGVLPNSPFTQMEGSIIYEWMRYLNYFVPVGQMVAIITAWLGAIGVWYIYRWALRFVKYID